MAWESAQLAGGLLGGRGCQEGVVSLALSKFALANGKGWLSAIKFDQTCRLGECEQQNEHDGDLGNSHLDY